MEFEPREVEAEGKTWFQESLSEFAEPGLRSIVRDQPSKSRNFGSRRHRRSPRAADEPTDRSKASEHQIRPAESQARVQAEKSTTKTQTSIRRARSSTSSRLKNVPVPAPGQVSQTSPHFSSDSTFDFQNGQVRHWIGLTG